MSSLPIATVHYHVPPIPVKSVVFIDRSTSRKKARIFTSLRLICMRIVFLGEGSRIDSDVVLGIFVLYFSGIAKKLKLNKDKEPLEAQRLKAGLGPEERENMKRKPLAERSAPSCG